MDVQGLVCELLVHMNMSRNPWNPFFDFRPWIFDIRDVHRGVRCVIDDGFKNNGWIV